MYQSHSSSLYGVALLCRDTQTEGDQPFLCSRIVLSLLFLLATTTTSGRSAGKLGFYMDLHGWLHRRNINHVI